MARAMKDSGIEWIGQIPEEWGIEKNKHCFICTKEIVGSKSIDTQLLSLTTKGVRKKSQEDVSGKIPESYDTYQVVDENDLIMCLFDLDCSAVFSGISKYSGMVSPAYKILKCRDNYDPNFADYWFSFVFDGRKFKSYAKNLRYTLSYDEFGILPIIQLSLNEQQKVANFLNARCASIDAVIEKTKASIEEYKKLKQAIITQAVTRGIRPNRRMKNSGIDYIGEIPEDWDICKVKHIGLLQNGISKGAEFFGEGFPFVSYGDVYKNMKLPGKPSGLVQTTEGERKLYSVKKGDIFFTRTSETIEEVGFSSVCFEDIENATFAGFLIRLRPFDEKLDLNYSAYYFRSLHHRFYLVKQMNLVTRASLGQPLLNGMIVLVPEKNEQIEIAEYLDDKCKKIDSLILCKEEEIQNMELYKKSLIYEYVTGKKQVAV